MLLLTPFRTATRSRPHCSFGAPRIVFDPSRDYASVRLCLLEDQTSEEQERSFADVLEKTVNPMLEMCTMMVGLMKADRGEKGKGMGHSGVPRQLPRLFRGKHNLNASVPVFNGMGWIQGVLQLFSFTKPKIQELERKMDEQVQILVAAHVSLCLANVGYQPYFDP
jgi:hypothetical protein